MAYRERARICPGVLLQVLAAARAAATAASTSLLLAAATCASGLPVEGLMVSRYLPLAGFTHWPLMKSPKGWRSLSQSNTRVGDSGAGPYSIVSKISVTFMLSLPLDHRVVVCRRVVTGSEVRKLPFDVGKQAAGANAEERIVQPLVAQLLFHQDQPIERLFGTANAASRLKAYLVASSLEVIADGPHHYQADRERSVDRLFAGGGFDEISAGHHADETRHTGVAQGGKLVSGKDGLHVRLATGVTESPHFIV